MCQRIHFDSTRKTHKLDRIGAPGGRFKSFDPFCRKSSEILEGRHFDEIIVFEKVSQCQKNVRGPFGVSNVHFVAKIQKIEGGPFGDFFSKKVLQCQKKRKEDPLVSAGIVTPKKRKNPSLVWFPGPTDTIWRPETL